MDCLFGSQSSGPLTPLGRESILCSKNFNSSSSNFFSLLSGFTFWAGANFPSWQAIPDRFSSINFGLRFRLCFVYNKEADEFVAHILDPGIWNLKLAKKGKDTMGRDWRDPSPSLQSLTFKDLDGRSLQFAPNSVHRPFKRALNFQARQARKYAIRRGWRSASWDFEDFFTEGLDISEKLKLWGFGAV